LRFDLHLAQPLQGVIQMPKVLALTANPDDQTLLHLDREMREVRKRLAAARATGFELIVEPAAEAEYLLQTLQRHDPDILHFSGHGSLTGLLLDDVAGGGRPVSKDALEGVFRTLRNVGTRTRCVVLNSCYSQPQAKAIARSVEAVVGMSSTIDDRAAIAFAVGFYEALAFARDVRTAFELGCHQLAILGFPDEQTPRLIPGPRARPEKISFSPHPEIWAEFLLSKTGSPRQQRGRYEVRRPSDVVSVIYQFDKSFKEEFHRDNLGGIRGLQFT
jgi:hypothetical protein